MRHYLCAMALLTAAWLKPGDGFGQLCTPNPDACTPDPTFGICYQPQNLNVGYLGFNFEHTVHLLAAKAIPAPPNQFGINVVYPRRLELLRVENLPAGVNVRVVSSNPGDHPMGYHQSNAQGQFPPGTMITRLPPSQDTHPTVGLYPCMIFYGLPQQITQITDSVRLVFNLFIGLSDEGDGLNPNSFQPGFNPQRFNYPVVIREVAQVAVQPIAPVCTNDQVVLNAAVIDNVGSPALPLEPLIRWRNAATGEILGTGNQLSVTVTETTTFEAFITDDLGNEYFGSTTVVAVPGVQITDLSVTPACPSTGQQSFAYVVPSGGTGNYIYFWTPVSGETINDPSSPTQAGLAPGTYEVYVQDDSGSGCNEAAAQIIVPEPISLSLSGPVQHPTQPDCIGSFRVQAAGGSTSDQYRYYINGANPNSTGIFDNLSAGTYSVTARAVENGVELPCTATLSVTVNPCAVANPPVFIVQLQRRPFTAGTNNGRIRARAAAGTIPYRWQLFQADGATPAAPEQNNVNPVTFDNLPVAIGGTTYVVRVTDAAGQTAEVAVRLN